MIDLSKLNTKKLFKNQRNYESFTKFVRFLCEKLLLFIHTEDKQKMKSKKCKRNSHNFLVVCIHFIKQ